MPLETIKQVLMRRDKMSEADADNAIRCAKEELAELIEADEINDAMEICATHFGLEPDYLDELY